MDLSNRMCRLQQEVNELSTCQHQITSFLGGTFAKVVQESLEDLQNRLTESERTVAHVNQERKNDRSQMERTMAFL